MSQEIPSLQMGVLRLNLSIGRKVTYHQLQGGGPCVRFYTLTSKSKDETSRILFVNSDLDSTRLGRPPRRIFCGHTCRNDRDARSCGGQWQVGERRVAQYRDLVSMVQ